MTVQTKPSTYTKVWASTGSKVAADDFKIARGWEVEKPPYEMMNWLQNRQDQWIAHANQRGIAQWDANTEYKANLSYVTGGTTGNVYRATINNTNINPDTDVSGTWVVAFASPSSIGLAYLAKANNLSDVSNVASARTNLDVYSKSEVYAKTEVYNKTEADTRYLSTTQNLFDVPNKATARANLEVYSKAEVDAMFPAGEVCMFAMGTMPAGFIPCDGRSLSRAAYPRLFAAIGTLYGAVDASSFNVPEFRGEFLRAWSAGRTGVDTGRAMGTWQQDAIRNIVGAFTSSTRNNPNPTGAHYSLGIDGSGGGDGSIGRPRIGFDASRQVPTAEENRVRNYPVYVGVRF